MRLPNTQKPSRPVYSPAGRVWFLRHGSRKRLLWLSIAMLWACLAACRPQPTPSPSPTSTIILATENPTPAENHVFLPAVVGPAAPTSTLAPSPSVTPSPTATRKPTRTPAPTATPLPPAIFKPGWGVQAHLFGVDIDQVLNWAQGTGVEWIKQQVEWTNIEYAQGEYDWRELDQIVDKTTGYGLKLMLSVNHAPTWTRLESEEYGPPNDPAEFGRFMGVLAERYTDKVAAYELWNEPNLRREWHGEDLDPALFVALIREGALAVQSADPSAQIISGAPAVTGINDGETAVDDRVYLQGMVAAGVGQWVDGIGVHPYGFANPPQERSGDAIHASASHNNHPSFFFRDTLEDYRAILVNGGLASSLLWVTEFGWPSVDGLGAMDTTGWEYAQSRDRKAAGRVYRAGVPDRRRPGLDRANDLVEPKHRHDLGGKPARICLQPAETRRQLPSRLHCRPHCGAGVRQRRWLVGRPLLPRFMTASKKSPIPMSLTRRGYCVQWGHKDGGPVRRVR